MDEMSWNGIMSLLGLVSRAYVVGGLERYMVDYM